jgi:hypothetical protein
LGLIGAGVALRGSTGLRLGVVLLLYLRAAGEPSPPSNPQAHMIRLTC